MDPNINAQQMLMINQKVKELIVTENLDLLLQFLQKFNLLFQPIDANNLTSLHFAVQMNRKNVVYFLCKLISISKNSDNDFKGINTPDIMGRTPLHNAAAKGNLEIINCLILNGSDVNAKTISGETPLMKAISFYQIDSVKFLLKWGSNPEMKNEVNGKDCYQQALDSRNDEMINVLKMYKDVYVPIAKKIWKVWDKGYKKNLLQNLSEGVMRRVISFLMM